MTETTVTPLMQPGEFCDQLTSVLHSGAQVLLTQAIEAEVASFMACLRKNSLRMGAPGLYVMGIYPNGRFRPGLERLKSGSLVFGIGLARRGIGFCFCPQSRPNTCAAAKA